MNIYIYIFRWGDDRSDSGVSLFPTREIYMRYSICLEGLVFLPRLNIDYQPGTIHHYEYVCLLLVSNSSAIIPQILNQIFNLVTSLLESCEYLDRNYNKEL